MHGVFTHRSSSLSLSLSFYSPSLSFSPFFFFFFDLPLLFFHSVSPLIATSTSGANENGEERKGQLGPQLVPSLSPPFNTGPRRKDQHRHRAAHTGQRTRTLTHSHTHTPTHLLSCDVYDCVYDFVCVCVWFYLRLASARKRRSGRSCNQSTADGIARLRPPIQVASVDALNQDGTFLPPFVSS